MYTLADFERALVPREWDEPPYHVRSQWVLIDYHSFRGWSVKMDVIAVDHFCVLEGVEFHLRVSIVDDERVRYIMSRLAKRVTVRDLVAIYPDIDKADRRELAHVMTVTPLALPTYVYDGVQYSQIYKFCGKVNCSCRKSYPVGHIAWSWYRDGRQFVRAVLPDEVARAYEKSLSPEAVVLRKFFAGSVLSPDEKRLINL